MAHPSWFSLLDPRAEKRFLTNSGIKFSVQTPAVEEIPTAQEGPPAFASRMARSKAEFVSTAVTDPSPRDDAGAFCLGADTVVTVDGAILGKPRDDAHARSMLGQLAERVHWVVTSIALARAGDLVAEATVTTEVTFRELSPSAIDRYIATGEGKDKAGSYAIQGLGAGLVQGISGSYTNVVGLPAAETVELLLRAGALVEWP